MSKIMSKNRNFRDRAGFLFQRWGTWVCRHPFLVIAASLAVGAIGIGQLPELRADFSTEAMLQPDDPALSIYDDFCSEFERDDTLVIALAPPEVFDLEFLETLRAFHTALENELPYVDDITSLINARSTRGDQERLIVEELMVDWPENAEDLAHLRAQVLANPIYANTLISRQADLTMIVIQPQVYASDEGVSALSGFDESEGEAAFLSEDALNEMVQSARSIAQRFESPDFPVHIVGEPVISDHMNRVSQADTSLYTGLSIALIIVLLYALFRRVSAVVLSLIVVVISAITSFGWMALLGIPFTTPSQILPSLILAVGICDSVHILAIVYQGLAKGQERELAIANALEHSGLAVVMTSLTTAAGLVSFIGASIRPVSDLGLLAPIAIMTALFYTLTLLPALLALWPLSPARNQLPTSRLKSALTRMGGFSMRRPVWVLSGTLALVTFSGIGIAQLRFGLDTLAWIPEDDPIRVATELIDSRMEGIGRVEILIDSHREDGLLDPENLARIEAASKTAESFALGPVSVGKAVSLVDIAKETHQALNENNPAAYILPQDRPTLAQEMLLFENSGWEDLAKVTTTSFDRARLSLQVPMVDAVFYPDFLEELQKRLERILGDDLTLQITGATALTSNSFLGVMHSMASSYVFALVLITPLMILMLGNLSRGLLCMIPNLLPVVVVLGYMGWMDIPLNLPTLLIGGIIIGLAVDDTIHFMHTYSFYLESGDDPATAVRRTLSTTGMALLVTSLVLTGSFLVYLAGYMKVMNDFGQIAALGTSTAFLADLLVAPALIAITSPLRDHDRVEHEVARGDGFIASGRGQLR